MSEHSDNKGMSLAEAKKTRSVEPPFTPRHKSLVSALVISYFAIIILWVSPEGPLKASLIDFIRPVAISTGIAQGWSLFSPELRTINLHSNAMITFADGSTKMYEFPRMDKLGLWGAFQREKMRKLFVDNIPFPGCEAYLPGIARFIARANLDPANQPTYVSLGYNWSNTPLPDEKNWVTRDNLPEHGFHTTIYVYKVREQDLR